MAGLLSSDDQDVPDDAGSNSVADVDTDSWHRIGPDRTNRLAIRRR